MDINVQQSSQNFGMAFIRPKKPDVVEHFYRVRSKRLPKDEIMEKGLMQLEFEHRNDVHFDFMYNEGAFPEVFGQDTIVIRPKSKIAKAQSGCNLYTVSSAMQIPNKIDTMLNELKTVNFDEIKSPVKRFFAQIKMMHKIKKMCRFVDKNPKELLPDNLRKASDMVTEMEKSTKLNVD